MSNYVKFDNMGKVVLSNNNYAMKLCLFHALKEYIL